VKLKALTIFHIIAFISPRSWCQPESRWVREMIYERALIKGVIWKMTCYNVYTCINFLCKLCNNPNHWITN
jgi:hypothetical protein